MKKKNTLIGSDFEKICGKICFLKVAQLIKSVNRLHIFGIRRFDNKKYFEVAKRISLRKNFIEIDHLPIQPFHCCAPLLPEVFFVILPRLQIVTPFFVIEDP